MSPFPLEAIDEIILSIDEALGTSDAPKTPMRGWIRKKAKAADIRVFLGGLKWDLERVKSALTDKEHQDMLREYGDPEQIVLCEGAIQRKKVTDKKDWNHFRATNIQWDVDDPKDLECVPDKMWVAIPPEVEVKGPEAIEEYMSDYITDNGGFCHKGFDIEW